MGTFEIRYTSEAVEDLKRSNRRDPKEIIEQVDLSLKHEPERETRNNKVEHSPIYKPSPRLKGVAWSLEMQQGTSEVQFPFTAPGRITSGFYRKCAGKDGPATGGCSGQPTFDKAVSTKPLAFAAGAAPMSIAWRYLMRLAAD